jgi:hypothetical protein
MKRIITLFLALGSFMLVQAQSNKIEEARRVIKNEPRTGPEDRRVYDEKQTRYPRSVNGSGDSEVERVNREYDQKIESIRNNPYLSTEEKNRAIRQLNSDRARMIKQVSNRNESRGRDRDRDYDDDDDDDDDRYEKKSKKNKVKSNNGKHKGWEKGKGNQKKNRD